MEVIRIHDPLTTEEKHLRGELVKLQREYQQAAKPFVDRLVALESMKSPRIFISDIPPELAEEVEHLLRNR